MDKANALSLFPTLPEQTHFTPEFRLLTACSWIAPAGQATAQSERIARLCSDGIDWGAFIALVDRHRVPAIAYAALRQYAGELFPDTAREPLKERSARARREALRHAAELVRLAKKCCERGIDVLTLKGALLSDELYADLGMRQSRDIDLLVRPGNLDQADQFFKAEGYRRTFPAFELTARQKIFLLDTYHHYEYDNPERETQLELHWRLDLWEPEQVAELWNNCRPRSISGASINYLDDPTLLLCLCDHGAQHAWFRLKWLGDIAVLLTQKPATAWDHLPGLAVRLDLRRPLAQALLLAHWLYDIPLAGPLRLIVAEEKAAVSLAAAALKAMLKTECARATFEKRLPGVMSLRYRVHLRTRLPFRAYLKILAIQPCDFDLLPLPDRLFGLYSLLRPLLWLWRQIIAATAHTPNNPIRQKNRI